MLIPATKYRRRIEGLPPGPSSRFWTTLRFTHSAGDYLRLCRERYGDTFTLSALFGKFVVTGDPQVARAMFSADPSQFEPFGTELLGPILGEGSLVLLAGERHKRQRRLLAPAFHGNRMRAYGEVMRDVALRHAAVWSDAPIVAHQTTEAISLELIIRNVFGIIEAARVATFRDAILTFVRAMTPRIMIHSAVRSGLGKHVGPWARFSSASGRLRRLLRGEVGVRRALRKSGTDILSLLLEARDEGGAALEDEELVDALLTLLIAGYETTSSELAWAFYWIHRHPEVHAKLLAELGGFGANPDPEEVSRFQYLEAVCNEVMRLHPVLLFAPRKTLKPFRVGDHVLPPGTGLVASTALVHSRPDLYPAPDRFEPERFLRRQFAPSEFFPFGGGNRRCIGAPFAVYQMKVVLATLLTRYRLRLASSAVVLPVRKSVMMVPGGGVPMKLCERAPGVGR